MFGDEAAYAKVIDELQKTGPVPALWAKAFAGALYDAGGAVLARHTIPAPIVNAYLSEFAD